MNAIFILNEEIIDKYNFEVKYSFYYKGKCNKGNFFYFY